MSKTVTFTLTSEDFHTLWTAVSCGINGRRGDGVGVDKAEAEQMVQAWNKVTNQWVLQVTTEYLQESSKG